MDFPSNSQAPKPQEPKKIEKIALGEVTRKQKSLGRRFMETFVSGEDASSVMGYILFDVVVPAAKDLASDAFSQMVDRFLYGDGKPPHRRTGSRSSGSSGYVSYNRFSSSTPYTRPDEAREANRRTRGVQNFDDLVLATRAEAQEVIERMFDIISRYETVSVADLYELVGETPTPIDHKWGWSDMRGAGVTKTRAGYLLDLPKPEPINSTLLFKKGI